MTKTRRKTFRTTEQWRDLLEEQVQSGATIKDFCDARGLCPSSFHRWRNRLMRDGSEAPAARFVEVEVLKPSERWEAELTLRSGAVLRLR